MRYLALVGLFVLSACGTTPSNYVPKAPFKQVEYPLGRFSTYTVCEDANGETISDKFCKGAK
tara:strand:- start:8980 stop:9165 length:186 start_codon:yes stop_codon:yes gene_type:complete